jgi:hypothetical protein
MARVHGAEMKRRSSHELSGLVSIPLRSNKLHALANPFALPSRCGGAWRDPNGSDAIADQLSMVRKTLWELDCRTNVLLFHELSTV